MNNKRDLKPGSFEELIILIWYQPSSSERRRRHILGRGDTAEAIHCSPAVIDVPVYYPTLSSQYFSHEYAIASIDGLVRGFIA